MIALEKAREMIGDAPTAPSSLILKELLQSLESGTPFLLAQIYDLDYAEFELALDIIQDWRLHRYGRSVRKQARPPAAVVPHVPQEGGAAGYAPSLS